MFHVEQFQIVCDANIVCQNAKIVVDSIRGLCYTISMKIREDISSFSAPRGRGAAVISDFLRGSYASVNL